MVRVNRGIDHVLRHLDAPVRLDAVAKAAGFSAFHFHRIFKSLLGESLGDFVKRVRLERSVVLMDRGAPGLRKKPSLTDIALACGFASSADFTRCFKQHFGVAPSKFDVGEFRRSQRQTWQDAVDDPDHRHLLDRLPPGENPDGFEIQLRSLPARRVVYQRVANAFTPGRVTDAAREMVAWAQGHDIADGEWLGYMWDDPEIVAPADCRYDVGLTTAELPANDLGLGRIDFPAMTVAELEIIGGIDLEQRALDWLYQTWLPASGHTPLDQPCFEAWNGLPFAHGLEHFELRLQLPVGKL